MSKLADMIEFYAKDAWKKDEEGKAHPSTELLADQGARAIAYRHAHPKKIMDAAVSRAHMMIQIAKVADALRDLCIASNMPASEARNLKVASACWTLQVAEYELREMETR